MKWVVLTLCLCCLVEVAGADEDWHPLDEIIDQSKTTAPMKRCAGLYQSLFDFIGPENMSEKAFNDTDGALKALVTAASVIDRESGVRGTALELMTASMEQARIYSKRYVSVLEEQERLTGNPFLKSDFIMADMLICKTMADKALQNGFGDW